MRSARRAALLIWVGAAQALALSEPSIRPTPRPGSEAVMVVVGAPMDTAAPLPAQYDGRPVSHQPTPRPQARPGSISVVAPVVDTPQYAGWIRPRPRPASAVVHPHPVTPAPVPAAYGAKGRICGDSKIRGERVAAIPGKLPGCGLREAVRVYEVDGVRLRAPAVVNCDTAHAIKRWVQNGARPAVGRLGGGLVELRVVASYSCRTRNNRPGAKISEHGRGKAIDIAAVRLKNGTELNVLRDWSDPVKGKVLRRMHRSACGPFGTVLGPDADRYHRDHFHFDTARHGNGNYCR